MVRATPASVLGGRGQGLDRLGERAHFGAEFGPRPGFLLAAHFGEHLRREGRGVPEVPLGQQQSEAVVDVARHALAQNVKQILQRIRAAPTIGGKPGKETGTWQQEEGRSIGEPATEEPLLARFVLFRARTYTRHTLDLRRASLSLSLSLSAHTLATHSI